MGTSMVDTLRNDVRQAWRALVTRPLHTGLSVLTLGLGIGGTAAVAGVAQEALLRPLPYPRDRELVAFWDPQSWSAAEFTHLRGRFDGFDAVAAWRPQEVTLRSSPWVVADGRRASASKDGRTRTSSRRSGS